MEASRNSDHDSSSTIHSQHARKLDIPMQAKQAHQLIMKVVCNFLHQYFSKQFKRSLCSPRTMLQCSSIRHSSLSLVSIIINDMTLCFSHHFI